MEKVNPSLHELSNSLGSCNHPSPNPEPSRDSTSESSLLSWTTEAPEPRSCASASDAPTLDTAVSVEADMLTFCIKGTADSETTKAVIYAAVFLIIDFFKRSPHFHLIIPILYNFSRTLSIHYKQNFCYTAKKSPLYTCLVIFRCI